MVSLKSGSIQFFSFHILFTNPWIVQWQLVSHLAFCNYTNVVFIEIGIGIIDVDSMCLVVLCHTNQQFVALGHRGRTKWASVHGIADDKTTQFIS